MTATVLPALVIVAAVPAIALSERQRQHQSAGPAQGVDGTNAGVIAFDGMRLVAEGDGFTAYNMPSGSVAGQLAVVERSADALILYDEAADVSFYVRFSDEAVFYSRQGADWVGLGQIIQLEGIRQSASRTTPRTPSGAQTQRAAGNRAGGSRANGFDGGNGSSSGQISSITRVDGANLSLRQSSDGTWTEFDTSGNRAFTFRELHRTGGAIELHDDSRNIGVILDVANGSIRWRTGVEGAGQLLARITDVGTDAPEQARGQRAGTGPDVASVTRVDGANLSLRQSSDGTWTEFDTSGNRAFTFRELHRTGGAIELHDDSRNIGVILDVANGSIRWRTGVEGAGQLLARITDVGTDAPEQARGQRAGTGPDVASVTRVDGANLSLRQSSDGTWTEFDTSGNRAFTFRELHRTGGAIKLHDDSRNIGVILDVANGSIRWRTGVEGAGQLLARITDVGTDAPEQAPVNVSRDDRTPVVRKTSEMSAEITLGRDILLYSEQGYLYQTYFARSADLSLKAPVWDALGMRENNPVLKSIVSLAESRRQHQEAELIVKLDAYAAFIEAGNALEVRLATVDGTQLIMTKSGQPSVLRRDDAGDRFFIDDVQFTISPANFRGVVDREFPKNESDYQSISNTSTQSFSASLSPSAGASAAGGIPGMGGGGIMPTGMLGANIGFGSSSSSTVGSSAGTYTPTGTRLGSGALRYRWDSCGLADKGSTRDECSYRKPEDIYDPTTARLRVLDALSLTMPILSTDTQWIVNLDRTPRSRLPDVLEFDLTFDVKFHAAGLRTKKGEGDDFAAGFGLVFRPDQWGSDKSDAYLRHATQSVKSYTESARFKVRVRLNIANLKSICMARDAEGALTARECRS